LIQDDNVNRLLREYSRGLRENSKILNSFEGIFKNINLNICFYQCQNYNLNADETCFEGETTVTNSTWGELASDQFWPKYWERYCILHLHTRFSLKKKTNLEGQQFGRLFWISFRVTFDIAQGRERLPQGLNAYAVKL